jgi:flagellar motility protein MotE (MotC chaperone)
MVIYDLNNKYENIFKFDFRLCKDVAMADSLASVEPDTNLTSDITEVKKESDPISEELEQDFEETKNKLAKTTRELTKKEEELAELKKRISVNEENNHTEWLKSTVKLYEEMESGKASELLKSLPVDEARELIYSMKKKRAAEILSNLDTETVKRLTRAKK